ncbi:TetR/AcrR family transcriptional regulator [Geobacter sp.]|uniref:TetR/AcrR family transcriptional regulator n=1 Tax=Geobacter sp. TaxID=46610 RepID=UPI001AC7542F|nr:TetR/AcrR family transcriptional regulator [Geobacter sp.]CAG0949266.1 HTH-type transcriptional regulator SrpR [Geobacteraceae bacterium]
MAIVRKVKPVERFSVTRERILDTAIGLFSTKGYSGATTREIAQQAGVAEVTLFRHFTSKEKLLEAVISHYSAIPGLKSFLPKALEMPYEEALVGMADMFLDTLVQIKDWIRVMHAEVQRSPDKFIAIYHSFLDELLEIFASYFRELQKRGVLRNFDPDLGARVFHSMFYCFFNMEELLGRKKYRPTDRTKAVREFVSLFIRGTLATQG